MGIINMKEVAVLMPHWKGCCKEEGKRLWMQPMNKKRSTHYVLCNFFQEVGIKSMKVGPVKRCAFI